MELGDRELAGGHVVQECEQRLEHVVVRVRIGAQEEHLGVELFESALELVGVGHLDDALDTELVCLVPALDVGPNHDRVGCTVPSALRSPDEEDWKLRRAADAGRHRAHDECVGALTLGRSGLLLVGHLDQHGDPVAFRDRLAQPAHRAGWYSANTRRGIDVYPDAMSSRVLVGLLLGLVLVGSAAARTIEGTERSERLLGTPRADAIRGLGGNDRLVSGAGTDFLSGGAGRDVLDAGAGNDRIVAQYDGSRDRVLCGAGLDIVNADLLDAVSADCETVGRRLSRDPYTNPESQHETEVEPDSFTVGRRTVATFQVGRRFDGAATNIGFAVSNDDGRTWRSGLLPGLTVASRPAGPHLRASDPVVAYDAASGTWLISTLALEGPTTRLTISRSSDGFTWSNPVIAIENTGAPGTVSFDKNWHACDNATASPFRGRCYLAYTDPLRNDRLAVVTSSDGGLTWSLPVGIPVTDAVGAFPVLKPDGTLVVVFLWHGDVIASSVSTDGGATFGSPAVIAEFNTRQARGLRLFPLPSADVDPSGRVWATWHDCRFSPGCAANSVVTSTSTDGRTWSAPAAITSGRNAMLPAVGIHPVSGRAAFVYHVVRPGGVDVELVEVGPDRRRLSPPRRLSSQTMRSEWMPNTSSGRMLADYLSVHYAGNRPLAVWILASEPVGSSLRQAVYATRS